MRAGNFRRIRCLKSLILIIGCFGFLGGQVFDNPRHPKNPKAGRVLALEEVLRIRDTGSRFFFENPIDVHVDPEGRIYYQEMRKLYVFGPDGKYLKNLYKKGEGPGELNDNLNDVLIQGDEIFLASSNFNKVIRMKRDGTFIEEIRPQGVFWGLIGYWRDRYFVTQLERKTFERKSQLVEEDYIVYEAGMGGKMIQTPNRFPVTISYFFGSRAGGSMTVSRIKTCLLSPSRVALIHSPAYSVKVLDLDKGEIIQDIRRDYPRLKYSKPWKSSRGGTMPQPEFQNDTHDILVHGEHLWVVTCTYQKDKGLLTDVFDKNGVYLDNFYIPVHNVKKDDYVFAPMTISADFLYVIERDEEDLFSIAKYRLPDGL